VEKFQQAFDYNTYGNGEIARALADMAKLKIASEDVTVSDKEKIVLELEREILFILERDPINVRMRMILADIYLDMAAYDSSYIDKAIQIVEPGFVDSPERLELHSIMASAYLIKNDLGKALDYLEQSMAIYDGREQDYLNMFYLLYKHNDIEKLDTYVNKYLARFDDISIENYNIISRYYINMLAGQKLLDTGILERLIELQPEVIGHRTILLDAYNSAGLKTEALEYINSMSAINPEWPDKLQKYWDLIQD
jgi:tetratricopeptide (TPR) repeat protein